MKVGVNLINFGPSAEPEIFRGWARLAEDLGYHFLMTSDHIALTTDVAERFPGPFYEPLTMLGWLASMTEKIEIGASAIILPLRSPIETARALANVDRLSGGRTILATGVGWAPLEYQALGLDFSRRGAMADDYLAAIKALWTNETASHHGPFVSFDDIDSRPLPVRKPHPPIWVGGRSEGAIRRAVRFGDGWHPYRASAEWLRTEGMPRLRERADLEGRPTPALCPRIPLAIADAPIDGEDRPAGCGSFDQIRTDLAALDALGASHVLLDSYSEDPASIGDHQGAWRALERMADEVFDLRRQSLR